MRVEQSLARSIDIDERRSPAAFQSAARFAKPSIEVAPVVGGEAARDKVEGLSFKRQMLGRCFYCLDVAQTLLTRCSRDRRQHLG